MLNIRLILLPIIILSLTGCKNHSEYKTYEPDFYSGGDISTLIKLEKNGAVFKDQGVEKDAIQIFKDHGMNSIRLRLFHTPNDSGPVCNSLPYTLEFAKRIKEKNMHFLLDFHYSDTWADPAKQYIPAVWENLSYADLKDSVYQYTRNVISAMKKQNTLPDLVQIGNEISNGMLWDTGRVSGEFDTNEQWNNFAGLVKAGIRGVKDGLEAGEKIKILIHFDDGSKQNRNKWFFDNLFSRGIDCDIICVSYYPMYHGSMDELSSNLAFLANSYNKDIFVVETGYPWAVHPNWPLDPEKYQYPGTPDGQKAFLDDMMQIVKDVPGNHGKGLFYWAPEWIMTKDGGGRLTSPTFARMALFDFEGNALPGMDAFRIK
jgi:arabinogalactan endo-1,4-beta-galactosidase